MSRASSDPRLLDAFEQVRIGERLVTLPEVGPLVRLTRTERKESLETVARSLGVTLSALSRYERGEMLPRAGVLARIVNYLTGQEVSLGELPHQALEHLDTLGKVEDILRRDRILTREDCGVVLSVLKQLLNLRKTLQKGGEEIEDSAGNV